MHLGVEKVDGGRQNSKFLSPGQLYNPSPLSVYRMEQGCEYDGYHFVFRLHCMVKMKAFCRWIKVPN